MTTRDKWTGGNTMLSMKDIAKLSGVSLKTVSRVLNNSDKVKEETRQKVLDVVHKEGYRPNIIAKSLKEQKTRTIIIFIDRHHGEYWGIWHTMIITAFMRIAKEMDYKVLISPSSASDHMTDQTDGFSFLTSGLADGAILMDNILEDQRIDFLIKNNIPHVVLGNCSNYTKTHWVDLNNYNAGYMGGEYLINKNYRSLVFLLGDSSFKVSQERARGFMEAMKEADISDYRIEYGISSTIKAYERVLQDIENNARPSAYFVSGDERALGVYRAVQEKGLRIPEDVAVLGIDNIQHGQYLYPSLSSINQPIDIFASQVITMLIKIIEGVEDVEGSVLIPYNLVEREST